MQYYALIVIFRQLQCCVQCSQPKWACRIDYFCRNIFRLFHSSKQFISRKIIMSAQVLEFSLEMTCEGCANAARKVLGKLPEVTNVDTQVEAKRVFVTSTLPADAILEALKKTGKECAYIGVKQ